MVSELRRDQGHPDQVFELRSRSAPPRYDRRAGPSACRIGVAAALRKGPSEIRHAPRPKVEKNPALLLSWSALDEDEGVRKACKRARGPRDHRADPDPLAEDAAKVRVCSSLARSAASRIEGHDPGAGAEEAQPDGRARRHPPVPWHGPQDLHLVPSRSRLAERTHEEIRGLETARGQTAAEALVGRGIIAPTGARNFSLVASRKVRVRAARPGCRGRSKAARCRWRSGCPSSVASRTSTARSTPS